MVETVIKSTNLNNKSTANGLDSSFACHNLTPTVNSTAHPTVYTPMHRNSPEEWLTLSDEDFKIAVTTRAEYALNSARSDWGVVKSRVDSKIREWTTQYAR